MKKICHLVFVLLFVISLSSCDFLSWFDGASSGSGGSSTSGANSTTNADTDEKRSGKSGFKDSDFESKYKSGYTFAGNGTPDDPIQITQLWQLYYIRATIHSKTDYDTINTKKLGPRNAEECHFKLMNDLDFATYDVRWCSTVDDVEGNYGDHFSGVFDGNGKTLKNFDGCAPLFNEITAEGIVKNLNIEGKIFFDSENFDRVGPFCKNLNGALINCTFNGTLSNAKYIYDVANSNDNLGVAIGCVSYNSGVSNGLSRGTKIVASVNGSYSTSVSQLNNELGDWNGLYKKNKKYQANKKFSSSSSKYELISGTVVGNVATPQTITPMKNEVFFSDNFRYIHSQQMPEDSKTSFFIPENPLISNKKIGIGDLADGTKVSLVPLNQSEVLGNGRTIYFYELRFYHRQLDGSYKISEVDLKKCYVDFIVNSGTKKALVLKYYAGSNMVTIYTDDFINSYGVNTYSAGKIYDLSISLSDINYNPSKSQISSMINELKD